MGLIDAGDDGRRFGPGFFDLIIVDEAHRSIYNRYGEIFDYFDALVVGLTATPRADVDHNTYRLFHLDDGVPTDAFELDDAIAGGYFVPPVARPIDLGFMTRGIRYADLSDAERERWDELEWQDGEIPDAIDAAAMNRWLFNEDTVDKVLEVLFTEGRRVGGGDRLGKTIIFAKNQHHADYIESRIDAHYPEQRGTLARVITHNSGPYAQTLIDAFATPGSAPDIAISVDMLDTGIDIPDVVNLVFFKPVNSATKFWQMVGRGTRLRPGLYGPGDDKADFVIFDVCGNIDFFNEELPEASATTARSLSERAFLLRTRLLALLRSADDPAVTALRSGLAARLHGAIVGMNRDNFIVRRHLRAVERFAGLDAWTAFGPEHLTAAAELAGLPSAAEQDADEAARRFDALVLTAQVAVAEGEPVRAGILSRLLGIVRALADQRSIPAVAAHAALLDAAADPAWWEGVDAVTLEQLRLRLRELVRLVGREQQVIVYTDFDDALADARELTLTRVVRASTGVPSATRCWDSWLAAPTWRCTGCDRAAAHDRRSRRARTRSHLGWRRRPRSAPRRSERSRRARTPHPLDRRHGAVGRRGDARRFRRRPGFHPPSARVRRSRHPAAHDRRPSRPAAPLRRPVRRARTAGAGRDLHRRTGQRADHAPPPGRRQRRPDQHGHGQRLTREAQPSTPRPMTTRMISFVPSRIWCTRRSRTTFSMPYSCRYPYPPCSCSA